MLYEPYIESASGYEELKNNLQARGFSNLPMGASMLLQMDGYVKAPIADTKTIEQVKIMIQKPN